jgi:hypothetical protein
MSENLASCARAASTSKRRRQDVVARVVTFSLATGGFIAANAKATGCTTYQQWY